MNTTEKSINQKILDKILERDKRYNDYILAELYKQLDND